MNKSYKKRFQKFSKSLSDPALINYVRQNGKNTFSRKRKLFPISGNINPLILLMQPYPEDLSSTKVHFQKEALILRFLPAFPLSFSYAHTVLGGFCVSFADAKKYALK